MERIFSVGEKSFSSTRNSIKNGADVMKTGFPDKIASQEILTPSKEAASSCRESSLIKQSANLVETDGGMFSADPLCKQISKATVMHADKYSGGSEESAEHVNFRIGSENMLKTSMFALYGKLFEIETSVSTKQA